MIVLDASLMAAWLLGERNAPDVRAVHTELRDEPVVVPAHWTLEISNTLRTALSAGRLSVVHFHQIMDGLDTIDGQRRSADAVVKIVEP